MQTRHSKYLENRAGMRAVLETGDILTVRALVGPGKPFSIINDRSEDNSLAIAIRSGSIDCVAYLIDKLGAAVINDDHFSHLNMALRAGSKSMIRKIQSHLKPSIPASPRFFAHFLPKLAEPRTVTAASKRKPTR